MSGIDLGKIDTLASMDMIAPGTLENSRYDLIESLRG